MSELQDFMLTFLFIFICPLLSLLDIGLDIYTAVSFYREEAYMSLSILLLFLVVSSVAVQFYSWFLYDREDFHSCLSQNNLTLLHVFQLGSFFRWFDSLSIATDSFTYFDPKSITENLSYNLGALRLIETLFKSIPQLVLMLTVTLQRGHLDIVTVLKAFVSASAIAVSVTMYLCSLRSFRPDKDKEKQPSPLSAVYILWNFLVILCRLTGIALFASVLPHFIIPYLLCYSLFVLITFISKIDFMDSFCGEWLYWPTEGLKWYFNRLKMVEGNTRYGTLLYYCQLLDIPLLCSLWLWKMSTEPPYFEIPQMYAIITAACVVSVYILSVSRIEVYHKYHPTKTVACPDHQHPM